MKSNFLQQIVEIDAANRKAPAAFDPPPRAMQAERHLTPPSYLELARMLERVIRRFETFLQMEMTRYGVKDIGPNHLMLLLTIGNAGRSVGELVDRGPYRNTNISYYLKQLTELEYIERIPSKRDKRGTRVRLSKNGQLLCTYLTAKVENYHRLIANNPENRRNLDIAFKTLDRIEQTWFLR